jgi:hypothetical protein
MVYQHFPEEEYAPIVEQIKSLKGAGNDDVNPITGQPYPVSGPCQ